MINDPYAYMQHRGGDVHSNTVSICIYREYPVTLQLVPEYHSRARIRPSLQVVVYIAESKQ